MKVKDLISLLYKVDSEAEICFKPLCGEALPIGNILSMREYSVHQEGYEPIKVTTLLLQQTEEELCEKT